MEFRGGTPVIFKKSGVGIQVLPESFAEKPGNKIPPEFIMKAGTFMILDAMNRPEDLGYFRINRIIQAGEPFPVPPDNRFRNRQGDGIVRVFSRMGRGKGNMPRGMPILGGDDFSLFFGKFFRRPVEGADNPVPLIDRQSAWGTLFAILCDIGRTKIILDVNYQER
jgi:hypothetical protein